MGQTVAPRSHATKVGCVERFLLVLLSRPHRCHVFIAYHTPITRIAQHTVELTHRILVSSLVANQHRQHTQEPAHQLLGVFRKSVHHLITPRQ